MNKLPNGWTEYKLKDLCVINYGKGLGKSNIVNGNIPVYSSGGIIGFHNTYNVNSEGVIIGRKGNAGSVFYSDKPFFCIDTAFYIEPNNQYDLKYLFYKLVSMNLKNHKTGTAIPGLIRNDIYKLSISIPPLDEQKRIASALSKIDAYLENTIKLIEEKERFKRGIAKKLLTCKEGENIPEARFKGFEDEWEIVKLGDMFDNFKEKNNEDKIILASTIDKGVIPNSLTERKIIRKKESLSNYKLVKKGCFVISLMSFQSGFEYSDYEGIISPAYTVLKPKIEMAHYFYKYYFKSFKFIKDLRPYAEGIRHGKQIKFKACKDILVPYPSIEEQEKIGGYLSLLDKEIDNLKKQKELIKEMKRGAMQKLLSGEVRLLE